MNMLFDNHNRPINYLRLAVTDRCNLRCFYCMPEDGIKYLPKKAILTFEEIERLITILANLGISKVRLTGGEPFVRNDLMQLIRRIVTIQGIQELHITTNGILTAPHIQELKQLNIRSVNMSLDTLDRDRFHKITRRDEFNKTWSTFNQLLDAGIPVKLNAVVMDGKNTDDILPMVELTRNLPVSVRFIEEMPFNGAGNHYPTLHWTYKRILAHIQSAYPELEPLPLESNATASEYRIPDYQGKIGIIAAFSRTFCGTCNRIRVTAQGTLKTCLYDQGVLDVRALLRGNESDSQVAEILVSAFKSRPKDGFEAEQKRVELISESMSTIGG